MRHRPPLAYTAYRMVNSIRLLLAMAGFLLVLATSTVLARSDWCIGDCDGNGRVTVNELQKGVLISLDGSRLHECPSFDDDSSGAVSIDELVLGVASALNGCPPTFTPQATATPSAKPALLLCGSVAELPRPNPPLARGVIVTLDPPGLMDATSSSGIFCFDQLTPGDYTLTVVEYQGAPSHCTNNGCWEPLHIWLETDILNAFNVMVPLPTPTTPTL